MTDLEILEQSFTDLEPSSQALCGVYLIVHCDHVVYVGSWAHEHRASFSEAARRYDCSQHAVRYHYYRMYSGLRSVAR